MKRRRILGVLGASVSVAGCLSDDSTADNTDPDSPDNPNRPFNIGNATNDINPHELSVRNNSNSSRNIELQIRDAETGETLLNQVYSVADGAAISGELRTPAEYEVQISLPDHGEEHVTTVDYFDTCNEYETIVAVTSDGTITSEMLRTDLECSSE